MKVISKNILADIEGFPKVIKLEILSEEISREAKPGQFVVLMVKKEGERIPLTIVDKNLDKKTITLIFQEVGFTTKLLGRLNIGDSLYALLGPLGNPTEIKRYGKVILIGGGIGIAEIFPVAKALRRENNYIITILGAKTKDLLILKDELEEISSELYIATDDGSYGEKGFNTDILERILLNDSFDLVYAVGPIPMMEKVSFITRKRKIKTIVSLNSLMLDGTGMCGVCRVSVGDDIRFTCVDGPEFDAHLIDWEELRNRNRMYEDKERYICKLYKLC